MNHWNWEKVRNWSFLSVPLIMGIDAIFFDGEILLIPSGYFDSDYAVGRMIIITCVWWFIVEVVFGNWFVKLLRFKKKDSSISKD
jgi:hypothetical protein